MYSVQSDFKIKVIWLYTLACLVELVKHNFVVDPNSLNFFVTLKFHLMQLLLMSQ